MSEFSWDEMPAEVAQDKAPKRDTVALADLPKPILAMAIVALKDQKFHYQPLPHKDLAADFMKFIRAAGDYTTPTSTILAKEVTEYPGPDGKTKKVTRGCVVRYSAGIRRGRKTDGNDEGNGESNGE